MYSEFVVMSLRPTLIDANQLQAIRQILNRNQMNGGGGGGANGGFSFGIGGGINRGLRRMGSFLGFLGQENNGRVRVFFILFFFVMIGVFLYYRYHAKQQGEVLNNDSIYGRFLKAVGFDNKSSGAPDVLPPSVMSNTNAVAQMGSLHPFIQQNTAPKSTTNYMIPNYRPVPTAQIPEDATYNPQLNNPQYNTHFVHLNNPPKYASTQNHPSYEHPPNVYYPQQSYGGQGSYSHGQDFGGQDFGDSHIYPPHQIYSQEVPFTYQQQPYSNQQPNYSQQNYHQQQQRQPIMYQMPPMQQPQQQQPHQMYNTTSRYTTNQSYDPNVY